MFFRTTTWRGRLVRLFESGDDEFTHVGVIVRTSALGLDVAHASPVAEREVRVDRLSDLLSRSEISSVAVYHPRAGETDARRAAGIALSYANAHTPFDDEFRLDEDRTVYCTELVWLAYRKFGLRIGASERILFPSDLVASGFFRPGRKVDLVSGGVRRSG